MQVLNRNFSSASPSVETAEIPHTLVLQPIEKWFKKGTALKIKVLTVLYFIYFLKNRCSNDKNSLKFERILWFSKRGRSRRHVPKTQQLDMFLKISRLCELYKFLNCRTRIIIRVIRIIIRLVKLFKLHDLFMVVY